MRVKVRAMVVAGVMSGTSADGVDVALVRVSPGVETPRVKVLGHVGFAYPKAVRTEVLRAMEQTPMSAGELSRLHWKLGEVYADCVAKACEKVGVKTVALGRDTPPFAKAQRMGHPDVRGRLGLVGMHGQTVFHEAGRATWQMGEAAVVREWLGVPVVSDFRPADMAAGGQAAPLVPMLDFCLFRSKAKNRVLLNLGGIANVTAIPAGAGLDGLLAFDTGPANMVVDALMQRWFAKSFDRGGKVAAKGRVLAAVVAEVMRDPYFVAAPPKSCGREQFGAGFASRFQEMCAAAGGTAEDAVATATELTAASVLEAYGRFCWSHLGQRAPLAKATEVIAAGGGVKNAALMKRLREGFGALGVKVLVADEFGVGAQAKEAVAFALLAWLTWHGMAGNVPAATGASGARVLGKVSF
jgi:anhydro-N-acetylmuramic acid kinase